MDGWIGWLSYTAVTPRASLQCDANNIESISFLDNSYGFNNLWLLLHVVQATFFTILFPPQTISAVWVQWRPEAGGAKVNVVISVSQLFLSNRCSSLVVIENQTGVKAKPVYPPDIKKRRDGWSIKKKTDFEYYQRKSKQFRSHWCNSNYLDKKQKTITHVIQILWKWI